MHWLKQQLNPNKAYVLIVALPCIAIGAAANAVTGPSLYLYTEWYQDWFGAEEDCVVEL